MVVFHVHADLVGGDYFADVEGHFEEVGRVLAVEAGVEVVLFFGFLEAGEELPAFPFVVGPAFSGVAVWVSELGQGDGWKRASRVETASRFYFLWYDPWRPHK